MKMGNQQFRGTCDARCKEKPAGQALPYGPQTYSQLPPTDPCAVPMCDAQGNVLPCNSGGDATPDAKCWSDEYNALSNNQYRTYQQTADWNAAHPSCTLPVPSLSGGDMTPLFPSGSNITAPKPANPTYPSGGDMTPKPPSYTTTTTTTSKSGGDNAPGPTSTTSTTTTTVQPDPCFTPMCDAQGNVLPCNSGGDQTPSSTSKPGGDQNRTVLMNTAKPGMPPVFMNVSKPGGDQTPTVLMNVSKPGMPPVFMNVIVPSTSGGDQTPSMPTVLTNTAGPGMPPVFMNTSTGSGGGGGGGGGQTPSMPTVLPGTVGGGPTVQMPGTNATVMMPGGGPGGRPTIVLNSPGGPGEAPALPRRMVPNPQIPLSPSIAGRPNPGVWQVPGMPDGPVQPGEHRRDCGGQGCGNHNCDSCGPHIFGRTSGANGRISHREVYLPTMTDMPSEVQVTYDPSITVVPAGQAQANPWVMPVATIAVAAAGIGLAWWLMRKQK